MFHTQVVVVLEDNGWRSQSMVNALATMLLQEMLGYRVVFLHDTHTQVRLFFDVPETPTQGEKVPPGPACVRRRSSTVRVQFPS